MRIGSVPYLNAKPLVEWFHTPEAHGTADIQYAVPSQLAASLREGDLDVANCSVFEAFQQPGLVLMPDISISANGAVKSVRLFSKVPLVEIKTVALDTSSLTSSALTRILLKEAVGIAPGYHHHAPDIGAMLARCDAALIIGDLRLFDISPHPIVYDLGAAWKDHTGLPFVYAAWLAREDAASEVMAETLTHARDWGVARLNLLATKWSEKMDLPLDQCRDYLLNVMDYNLSPEQMRALRCFQEKCMAHHLIPALHPLRTFKG